MAASPARAVLLTGATGGLGQAIARALAARGAQLVLTGRRDRRARAARRRARRRGRAPSTSPTRDAVAALARRVRPTSTSSSPTRRCRAPGRLDDVHARADRPRARRQPARADRPGARAARRGWSRAAAGSSSSSRRCRARRRRPAASMYSATKFGLRGFALGAARRPARHGRRRHDRQPRLHPRRGDVRRVGREAAAAASGRRRPRTSRARSCGRSSATRRRSTSPRSRCARAPRSPASRPASPTRSPRALGRRRASPSSSAEARPPSASARRTRRSSDEVAASPPVRRRRRGCGASSSLERGGSPGRSAASTSLASRGPSLLSSGVAWMRTTTSSPSISSSRIRGSPRVGVCDRRLEELLDVERRDAGAQARAEVDAGGLAQRDDRDVQDACGSGP